MAIPPPMSPEEVQEAVRCVISKEIDEFGRVPLQMIRSFKEDGVLTNNKGLVVRFEDGTEFQLTIVRSR